MGYFDEIQCFMHIQCKKLILVIKRNCPLSPVFMFVANNALFSVLQTVLLLSWVIYLPG
jgi:hypothetical protein